jgi:hypothetical protein
MMKSMHGIMLNSESGFGSDTVQQGKGNLQMD